MESVLEGIGLLGFLGLFVFAVIVVVLPITISYYLGQISTRLRHIRDILKDIRKINIDNI